MDDVSARLTMHNVSREVSGDHVTCHVTGESHVVSRVVNIRVAGKSHTVLSSLRYKPTARHAWRRAICLPMFFSARYNIYISRLCYDVSVRLSVSLSVTEVHWVAVHAEKRGGIISRYASYC